MVEPKIGGQGVVRRGGDDAIFEEIGGLEAEDADGFYANLLVGGSADDCGIGIVGNGTGENVCDAAACVRDANQEDFDGLEAAVEIEIQAAELADAEFVVDPDASVDFFSAVAAGFEAVFGFEQLDLRGVFFCFGGPGGRWLF